MIKKCVVRNSHSEEILIYQNSVGHVYVCEDGKPVHRAIMSYSDMIDVFEQQGFRKVSEYIES